MKKLEKIKERAVQVLAPKKYIFRCFADLHEYEADGPLPSCGMFCPGCKGMSPRPLLNDITPESNDVEDNDRAYLLKLVEAYQDMLSAMRNAQLPTDQMANLERMTQKLTALLEQPE